MTSYPALRELAEKEESALVERLLGRAQWYEEARPFYVKTPGLLREAASEIGSLLDKYDAALAEIDRLREARRVTGPELWEYLFGAMKGAIPATLTDEVLAGLATHIKEHLLCSH